MREAPVDTFQSSAPKKPFSLIVRPVRSLSGLKIRRARDSFIGKLVTS
jgi:hypothetical protein